MSVRYRALYFGTLPSGRAVREGGVIREEELEGRKPGLWMEEIREAESIPAPPPQAAPPDAGEVNEPEAAEPAESKRKLRNRK